MGNLQVIVLLLGLAFVVDFSLHKFVFPTLPSARKAKEVTPETPTEVPINETEPESEFEEEPLETKGISVQDEAGNEVPVNTSHVLDDTENIPPKPTRKVKKRRKGDFKHLNVHVKLCVQCNYMKHFESIRTHLQEEFPGIRVTHEEYPIEFWRKLLSYALIGIQLIMAAIIIAGDQLFAKLQIQPPAIYNTVKNNKMVAGALVYFAGNFLKSFITSTQAFEIFINGTLVSSAVQTGTIMNPTTLANEVLRFL